MSNFKHPAVPMIDIQIKEYEEQLSKAQDNYYHSNVTPEVRNLLLEKIVYIGNFIDTLQSLKNTFKE